MLCGSDARELGKERLDAIGDLDDVGARLALDVENDGALIVRPRRELGVLDAVGDLGHVTAGEAALPLPRPRRWAGTVGARELVVGGDRVVEARPVDAALRPG